MKKIKKIVTKILDKLKLMADILKIFICLPVGWLLFKLKDIYIVSERGTDARDNGYHMFKYITQNHPEKNVYYIIDKHSADYNKVAELGRVIHYKSWKHALFFVAARKKISTHVMGYSLITAYWFNRFRWLLRIPGKHIFLQHGVTSNDHVVLHAENTSIDLFICGAKPEYEFINGTFGYSEGVVQYTGFARYDNLHGHQAERQILVMPTWRMYLSYLSEDEFLRSEYFVRWNEILKSSELSKLLSEHDLKLVFYPHYEMQRFVKCFDGADDNVIIADFDHYDVQQLLISSALLITDYSSVFFDFAYMKKPSVYYQFDRDEFFSRHYKKGYFDYFENGFGDVALSANEFLTAVKKNVDLEFSPESKYLERMNDFFELYDNHNCERIYNAIEELK